MIIKGQRLDLLNSFQVITFEIASPELLPENTLQVSILPLSFDGSILPSWEFNKSVNGVIIKIENGNIKIIVKNDLIDKKTKELLFVLHAEKKGFVRIKLEKAGDIFIRINNDLFDVSEYLHGRALMAFSIYRRGEKWRLRAIGDACQKGLEQVYSLCGINPELAPHCGV